MRKLSSPDSHTAILYIHGYNDYFFQREMGDRFVDAGYHFYAVDLRKYGRSLLSGQHRYEVRDYREYFADIDSALCEITRNGNISKIFLMGHSNGGLILSYYMACGNPDKFNIAGLILNSPFLDMNLDYVTENIALPVLCMLSSIIPNVGIPQGDSNAYAQSLLKIYHGEWDYDTNLKLEVSPDVTVAWLNAVCEAQKVLQKGVNVKVPLLLMRSDKSVNGVAWTPVFNNSDAVLDVKEISKYGRRLSKSTTELIVNDGLHDLFLSRPAIRNALYNRVLEWMKKQSADQ